VSGYEEQEDHELTNAEGDKVQILLRNARQILNVVTATFPSFEAEGPAINCHEASSSIEELACQWRAITHNLANLEEGDPDTEAWLKSISLVSSLSPHLYNMLI